MSNNLEHAIERLRQIPEDRQDAIARFLLHEIEEEERWTCSTDAHAGKLQGLIDRIIDDDFNGRCEPADPDNL